MRATTALLALAALAIAASPVVPAAPATETAAASTPATDAPVARTGTIDTAENCFSLDPPAATALPVVDDTTTTVPLQVRVLLDVAEAPQVISLRKQGKHAEAQALLTSVVNEVKPSFEGARETYTRLAIDLRLSYDVLTVRDDQPSSTRELIAAAKQQYGGSVPVGIDVVYVATDNLVEGAVVGQADCVGGMAYDHHSFASGKIDRPESPTNFFGVTFFAQINVIIFAHEVGHLLGAHHHFTNCAESMTVYPGTSDVMAVCGVMINDVGLAGDLFSSVNRVIVRGYANEFAGQRG